MCISFSKNNDIWFYRQPGGCLEIGMTAQYPDTEDSLVHIDSDDVADFLKELKAYANGTDPSDVG